MTNDHQNMRRDGGDDDAPPLVTPNPDIQKPGDYNPPPDLPIPGEETLDKSQLG